MVVMQPFLQNTIWMNTLKQFMKEKSPSTQIYLMHAFPEK